MLKELNSWFNFYKGRKEAVVKREKAERVMCSLDILHNKLADLNLVEKGRDDPK